MRLKREKEGDLEKKKKKEEEDNGWDFREEFDAGDV